jgi:hypothetical protein
VTAGDAKPVADRVPEGEPVDVAVCDTESVSEAEPDAVLVIELEPDEVRVGEPVTVPVPLEVEEGVGVTDIEMQYGQLGP